MGRGLHQLCIRFSIFGGIRRRHIRPSMMRQQDGGRKAEEHPVMGQMLREYIRRNMLSAVPAYVLFDD